MTMLKAFLNSTATKIIGVSVLAVLIFFFDNIKGYYRFKQLCDEHQELIVYKKLEPNVGWQVDINKRYHRDIVSEYLYFIPQIKFFRFLEQDERRNREIYDGRFIGGGRVPYEKFDHTVRSKLDDKRKDPKNYEFLVAEFKEKVVYQLERFSEEIPNETRSGRSGYRLRDLRSNEVVVILEGIGYSLFEQDKTLLAAPSAVFCRLEPSIFSSKVHKQIFMNNLEGK